MPTKTKTRTPRQKMEKPVLVTTAHRGVFFGYTNDPDGETITLTRARNCLYWTADVKGFLGLCITGPTAGCRIGPAAPSITLRNITCVADVTPEAVKAWEVAPWSD
jgi:hypothetical protein